MITYDVHNHVGLDGNFFLRGWWPYAATAQDMIQHLDNSGIDRAVVFPFGVPSAFSGDAIVERKAIELIPGRVPFDRENPLLVQELDRIDTDNRLLMLAMFDPNRCVPEQMKNLEKLSGKFAGLKVQATVLESPIRGLLTVGRPLMEYAEAHDMPVLIHTSISPKDKWSQTRDCLDVAAAFPKARFNLAHSMRYHEKSLREALTLPNVWVDCSAHLAHCDLAVMNSTGVAIPSERVDADYSKPSQVLEVIHQILGSKYIWGSDNPFMSWCDDSLKLIHSYREETQVLKGVSKKVYDDMLRIGPAAWLGSAVNHRPFKRK